MTGAEKSANVTSFVRTARRLVIVQLFVGLLAIGAALWATYAISRYVKAREEADLARTALAAETAKAEAARDAAGKAAAAAEDYLALAAVSREVLHADAPKDFTEIAGRLAERVRDNPAADASVYALLATAHFRSDQPDRIAKAQAAISEAITRNEARLTAEAALPEDQRPAPIYNETIYLDRIAYLCAASPGQGSSIVLNGLQTYRPEIRAVLAAEGRAARHPLLVNRCGPAAAAALQGQIRSAPQGDSAAATAPDLYKVRLVFLHVGTEADRATARGALSEALTAAGYRLPAMQIVAPPFRAGVRYYYPEQRAEAERIAAAVRAAVGPDWPEAQFRAIRLGGYEGLPRDRVEVWLPPGMALAGGL